jgi:hypothetical protein
MAWLLVNMEAAMFVRHIVSSGLVALVLGCAALTSASSAQAEPLQRASGMHERFGLDRLPELRPTTSAMCVGAPRPKASSYCASTRPCRMEGGRTVNVCSEWKLIH